MVTLSSFNCTLSIFLDHFPSLSPPLFRRSNSKNEKKKIKQIARVTATIIKFTKFSMKKNKYVMLRFRWFRSHFDCFATGPRCFIGLTESGKRKQCARIWLRERTHAASHSKTTRYEIHFFLTKKKCVPKRERENNRTN